MGAVKRTNCLLRCRESTEALPPFPWGQETTFPSVLACEEKGVAYMTLLLLLLFVCEVLACAVVVTGIKPYDWLVVVRPHLSCFILGEADVPCIRRPTSAQVFIFSKHQVCHCKWERGSLCLPFLHRRGRHHNFPSYFQAFVLELCWCFIGCCAWLLIILYQCIGGPLLCSGPYKWEIQWWYVAQKAHRLVLWLGKWVCSPSGYA